MERLAQLLDELDDLLLLLRHQFRLWPAERRGNAPL